MKINHEATILNLVFKKLLIPAALLQCSLVIGALKFTKLPCPFVFLAKALRLQNTALRVTDTTKTTHYTHNIRAQNHTLSKMNILVYVQSCGIRTEQEKGWYIFICTYV